MTAKEKASELFNKFANTLLFNVAPGQREHAETLRGYHNLGRMISDSVLHVNEQAKKCALIHVDEILKLKLVQPMMMYGTNYMIIDDFYSQVKEELLKL